MKKARRFPFTERENYIIRESVKIFGEDWDTISKHLPGRTKKQIHDRYVNYLRDGLKMCPWTKQEDEILMQMYKAIGPKWSKMMIHLPGRSGNDIKNRWHKHLYKKMVQPANDENNKSSSSPESLFDDQSFPDSIFFEINNNDSNQNEQQNIKSDSSLNNDLTKEYVGESLNDEKRKLLLQNKQSEIQNFGDKRGLQENFNHPKNNNSQIVSSQFYQNKPNCTNQYDNPVRIINKVDIGDKTIRENAFSKKNQIPDFSISSLNGDIEMQEILEDMECQYYGFLWI